MQTNQFFIYMILDKLENADRYFQCSERLEQAFRFLMDNDLDELPACKIRLDSDDLYVNIIDFQGKEEAKCKMEAHKDYIDIQFIVNGEGEKMGWKPQEDCQEILNEYNEQNDVEFYKDKAVSSFTVPAGSFAVFFPEDAHQPGIAPGKTYRKVIVKVKVD